MPAMTFTTDLRIPLPPESGAAGNRALAQQDASGCEPRHHRKCTACLVVVCALIGIIAFFAVEPLVARPAMEHAMIDSAVDLGICLLANQSLLVSSEANMDAPVRCSIGGLSLTLTDSHQVLGEWRIPAMSEVESRHKFQNKGSTVISMTHFHATWQFIDRVQVTATGLGTSRTFNELPLCKEIALKILDAAAASVGKSDVGPKCVITRHGHGHGFSHAMAKAMGKFMSGPTSWLRPSHPVLVSPGFLAGRLRQQGSGFAGATPALASPGHAASPSMSAVVSGIDEDSVRSTPQHWSWLCSVAIGEMVLGVAMVVSCLYYVRKYLSTRSARSIHLIHEPTTLQVSELLGIRRSGLLMPNALVGCHSPRVPARSTAISMQLEGAENIEDFSAIKYDGNYDGNYVSTMAFCDRARVSVTAGDGGNGYVAFRPKVGPCGGNGGRGPCGGNGGRGGSVYLVSDEGLKTLKPEGHVRATCGKNGMGKGRHGESGKNRYVRVPIGTVVRDEESGGLLGELLEHGDELRVAKGGRGGRGNEALKTARDMTPQFCEVGVPGASRFLSLELKLVADIGLVGVPNAGKSTLLAATTRAAPQISHNPFTTTKPNLGVWQSSDVADMGDDSSFVIVDIPGLLQGAHDGVGMGQAFLRHIERCRVLVHVIDGSSADPVGDYKAILTELELFSPWLAKKPSAVVLNKRDITKVHEKEAMLVKRLQEAAGHNRVLSISAATKENCDELMKKLRLLLTQASLTRLPPEPIEPVMDLDRKTEIALVMPFWGNGDFQWEQKVQSMEFRVDLEALAQCFSGSDTFDRSWDDWRLVHIFDGLQELVVSHGWALRQQCGSWVTWVPRERNILADHLVNIAIDRRASFWVHTEHRPAQSECNFIIASDGAARKTTGAAAAAWTICSMIEGNVRFIAGGAMLLDNGTASQQAETQALQLAVNAMLRFSDESLVICPHAYDMMLQTSDLSNRIMKHVEC